MPQGFRFNIPVKSPNYEERVKLLVAQDSTPPPPRPGHDMNACSAGRACCCVLVVIVLVASGAIAASAMHRGGSRNTVNNLGHAPSKPLAATKPRSCRS